jgi:glucosamine kinase
MKIGVDGGATKTELVLVDDGGLVLHRHLAPGCNPNVVGPDHARRIVTDALVAIHDRAKTEQPKGKLTHSLLCMSGSPEFWQEFASSLTDFGRVTALDDSRPVLELATGGQPGLVLHGGTGSFVAAQAPDGSLHYAGGLGWRFGDPGSGYDIARRAISRALLELQGWVPPSRLAQLVRDHAGLADVKAITRDFYAHPEPNRHIAALAPAIMRLATEGDSIAVQIVLDSAHELLELALRVARQLFPDTPLDAVPAGLSGPVLVHPIVLSTLPARSPLPLQPLAETPIEGVRRLLMREL